jgi:hypothetical protein
MSTATLIAAAVVAVGTIVVALWLPGRSPAVDATTASLRALPAGEME